MDYITALSKIQSWCAYRERCRKEVRVKLFEFELNEEEIEQIIELLQKENFLNEERFANSFAEGKFRIKKWGRHKIKSELRRKSIDEKLIKKALDKLNPELYTETLKVLAEKKMRELRKEDKLQQKIKLQRFLLSRGFEQDLIYQLISPE